MKKVLAVSWVIGLFILMVTSCPVFKWAISPLYMVLWTLTLLPILAITIIWKILD